MGLWTLFEGLLLLTNSLAILNEDRFLAPRGWGTDYPSRKNFKGQIIGLINAAQYLRLPLIIANCIFIIVKVQEFSSDDDSRSCSYGGEFDKFYCRKIY
ncbi:hypothetical protein RIF29_17485 [Crotalaria pallida]|uniref:Immediate early response 3-interacting protein 1 n=1 Tax=Crotalaria pallida TaxID=3830 RepID=A0AAN9FKN5_CROPI